MDEVAKTFSPFSCQVDNTSNDDEGAASCLCMPQQLPSSDSENESGKSPYRRPPPISTVPSDDSKILSPLSQGSSTSTNSRPQVSVRRNNSNSPKLLSSTESLQLPTLCEPTKNDQTWVQIPRTPESEDPVFAVSVDDHELEVALRPLFTQAQHTDNEINQEDDESLLEFDAVMASRLSFEDLERKTDQIIHEARMAVLKQREAAEAATRPAVLRPHSLIHQGPMRLKPSAVPEAPDSPDTYHVDPASSSSRTTTRPEKTSPPLPARTPTNIDGRPPLSPVTPSGSATQPPSNVHMHWHSPAESTLGSIDDDEIDMVNLPFQFAEESLNVSREKVLRRIDGLASSPMAMASTEENVADASSSNRPIESVDDDQNSVVSTPLVDYQNFDTEIPAEMPKRVKKVKTVVIKSTTDEKKTNEESRSMGTWFSFLWGGPTTGSQSRKEGHHIVEEYVENIFPMGCGSHHFPLHRNASDVPSSLVRVGSGENAEGYADVVNAQELFVDPRMPDWIDSQCMERDPLPKGSTYQLGESRSIIVHELIRGSWTWCTAWSPDGRRLAMGTENHHLAVVDTFSSSVWRIKHDKRVTGPSKGNDITHSIRSIAWGSNFIATGGVGGLVSILSTNEPYPILHRVTPTGFVGSLDWLKDTNTLVIGSRNGKATIMKIFEEDDDVSSQVIDHERKIQSIELHTIDRGDAWVNAVKFSPGGKAVAVGDSKGILGVYGYKEQPGAPVSVSNLANFKLEDSILDVEWSPDGQWLYAGGEDFCVTVINTPSWEAIHRIKRDRWVQFISASHGCSHVALGGVSSEVSIMDVDRGWDTALNVSLKGLVPLSAKWHPQDQYLVLTGQNNSVLAIETTNSRYVSGHFLRSASPILAIQFSPDGRMAAIGNEAGIVTIFKLSGTSFTTVYELVLDGDGSLSIAWSKKGTFLVVVAGTKVVIVAKSSGAGKSPPEASGFHISQVVRLGEQMHDVALSPNSRYVAVSGLKKTYFLDGVAKFKSILEIAHEVTTLSNSWSPDGCWFATIGRNQNLLVYDTSSPDSSEWRIIFTVQTPKSSLTLAWGPPMVGGLQYLAYGGEGSKVYIMEIRTKERAWETVLSIPREGVIHGLDWSNEGLLAAAVGNGTVSIMDLSYLQSGWAVNEMDYNWQRQALTCFTEIRRNKGKNSMRSVRWIPSAPGSHSLLACGGTDGEVEIVDLTDRRRCRGFKAPVQ